MLVTFSPRHGNRATAAIVISYRSIKSYVRDNNIIIFTNTKFVCNTVYLIRGCQYSYYGNTGVILYRAFLMVFFIIVYCIGMLVKTAERW